MRVATFLLTIPMAVGSCCSVCSFAQNAVSTGSITGTVHDSSGNVVVHATVLAVNEASAERLTSSTNDSGTFSFPAAKIGVYYISYSSPGFKTAEVKEVNVGVGHTSEADVVLVPGAVSETVIVPSNVASELNPDDTTVGTLVQEDIVQNLPLSGRNYIDLVLLSPNVVPDGQFGHISFAGQPGGDFSGYFNSAGTDSNANGSTAFTVDGSDTTSYYYGDNRGYTRMPYLFGLQSIQEFQVQPNVYNAAYGGAAAGFINTVTKSGSSAYHGDAFYYNRNSATAANDAVDKAAGNPRPFNVLQQFGADLGGPIKTNRMFFYFDYEQQRQNDPEYAALPAIAATDETSFGVPLGTPLPSPNSHYPVAATISQAQATATPTNPVYLQGVANALNVLHSQLGPRERRRDEYEFFPKFDWQISDKTHLTLDYNYDHFQSPGGTVTNIVEAFAGDEGLGNNGVRDHDGTIHLTHAFNSSLVNDLYVSYGRDEQIQTVSSLAPSPTTPQITVTSPSFYEFGNFKSSYQNIREYQEQFADHLTYLHSRNQVEIGYDLNHDSISSQNFAGFYGAYTFTSLQAFALGKWNVFAQSKGNPKYNFSDPFMGFYFNDTYHFRSHLTLTGGLREEFQVYPNPVGNPAIPATQVFHNQYERVSPRVGFSYSPFSRMVVRGGVGLYYEIFDGHNYLNSTEQNGVLQTGLTESDFNTSTIAANQSPAFPAALPASNPEFTGATNIVTIASNFKSPSVINSSLQIDQQLATRTILTVGSLWSHGMHVTASTAYDENLEPPIGTTTYFLHNGSTVTGPNLDSALLKEGLINSSLGQINALISSGISNYNSFFVQLNRQAAKGLNAIVAYTFSKTTQNGVDFFNQFAINQTRSLSLLDQRQRLSIAGVYSPTVASDHKMAASFLNGWKVSMITQLNSGHPYSGFIVSSAHGDQLNDSAALESTANTHTGDGVAPGDGINSFTGPPITETDLGLERTFKIGEKQAITLKAQAFNLFNSANYYVYAGSGINAQQYNASGTTCGDGVTINQTCTLTPNNGVGGFQTLNSIDQQYPPRVLQFSFTYKF